MQVVSIKAADSSLVRIGLSDGSIFSFKTVYLPPDFSSGLWAVKGAEISLKEAESLRFAAGCYRAERAALALIARAEQTRLGLKAKLARKGINSVYIGAALDYLEGLGIISDERFAALWLESKLRRVRTGRGGKLCPQKLLASLLGRSIPSGIARKALGSALDSATERALLDSYIAGVFPNFDKGDIFVRQKLKAAGFSSAVIRAYWEDM
ncbi:MAG: RecX family transcriptional regulator [Spirochaetaceae bacterium]|jgi:regulatory protein|nr:RecX family transcriptional regulator [Spirochaetaceae bacterium]